VICVYVCTFVKPVIFRLPILVARLNFCIVFCHDQIAYAILCTIITIFTFCLFNCHNYYYHLIRIVIVSNVRVSPRNSLHFSPPLCLMHQDEFIILLYKIFIT